MKGVYERNGLSLVRPEYEHFSLSLFKREIDGCNTVEALRKALERGYAGIVETWVKRQNLYAQKHATLENFVIMGRLMLDQCGNANGIIYENGDFPTNIPDIMTEKEFWDFMRVRRISMNGENDIRLNLRTVRLPRPGTVCAHCKKTFDIGNVSSLYNFSDPWEIPDDWLATKDYNEIVSQLLDDPGAEYVFYPEGQMTGILDDRHQPSIVKRTYIHGHCYFKHLFASRQGPFEKLLAGNGFKIVKTQIAYNEAHTVMTAGPWYKITTQFGPITVGIEDSPYIFIRVDETKVDLRRIIADQGIRTDENSTYASGEEHAKELLSKIFQYLSANQPTIKK